MIRDPVDLGYTKETIGGWRAKLFAELGPYCVVCGHKAHHLHEGILWRSQVQGFAFPVRLRVFAECNVFPICRTCHESPPPRQFFFDLACEKYGEEAVRRWYRSFVWKVPPDRRFMP